MPNALTCMHFVSIFHINISGNRITLTLVEISALHTQEEYVSTVYRDWSPKMPVSHKNLQHLLYMMNTASGRIREDLMR